MNEWQFEILRRLLHLSVKRFYRLERKVDKIMATQADLDQALSNVETAIGQLGTDLTQAIADLQAAVKAAGTPVDLSAEVSRLGAIATSLTNFDAEAKAADPGAPAPPTGA